MSKADVEVVLQFLYGAFDRRMAKQAQFTRSIGNIRCSGYATCLQGFRSYASWQVGAWDWFRLLKDEYFPRGLVTVQTIVPVYAPASDHNDVGAYIAAVLHAVQVWRAGHVRV